MGKKIGGVFNGTGADIYLCLGFIPDEILLEDLEVTTNALLRWNKNQYRSVLCSGGFIYTAEDVAQDELIATEGITPYIGGEILTSTQAGTTTYGEGVYLIRDDNDYRYYSGNTNGRGDAVAVDIEDWTLGSSTNRTGNFNEDVNGTYIGIGSEVWIMSNDGKMYYATIMALTAGQGEAANEVTLSEAVPSGKVRKISGKYGFRPMVAGERTLDGVKCDYAWTNDNTIGFIAERWD